MSGPIVEIETGHPPVTEVESARHYAASSLSPATLRAYRSGLTHYQQWCADRELVPLPATADTVAAYLASLADGGLAVSTITQRSGAIRWAHEAANLVSPTNNKVVRATVAGIRRTLGVAPRQKTAATADELGAMLSHVTGDDLKALRDRAVLLFGFAMAARRSELVALDVGDIEERAPGILVRVRRSKTDQEGVGQEVAILSGTEAETCPVRALHSWIQAAGITEGRVFRSVDRHGRVGKGLSGRTIADIVKTCAARAGLEGDFSGHSLRAGFVTAAAESGVRAEAIAEHTRHRSTDMVRAYTRRADLFRSHPGEGLLASQNEEKRTSKPRESKRLFPRYVSRDAPHRDDGPKVSPPPPITKPYQVVDHGFEEIYRGVPPEISDKIEDDDRWIRRVKIEEFGKRLAQAGKNKGVAKAAKDELPHVLGRAAELGTIVNEEPNKKEIKRELASLLKGASTVSEDWLKLRPLSRWFIDDAAASLPEEWQDFDEFKLIQYLRWIEKNAMHALVTVSEEPRRDRPGDIKLYVVIEYLANAWMNTTGHGPESIKWDSERRSSDFVTMAHEVLVAAHMVPRQSRTTVSAMTRSVSEELRKSWISKPSHVPPTESSMVKPQV